MPLTLGTLASSGTKTRLEYQTSTSVVTTTHTSYTFSGVSFGSAEAGRLIVVLATRNDSITGVTIGGVTATLIQASSASLLANHLYAAVVPTGTSGNVVVTGGNGQQVGIIVWALYGVNATKKSSGAKSTTANYPSLTLAAGDIAIFGDWDGSSVTYTNATKNAGYMIGSTSSREATGASYRAASSETRTVSNTSGGTGYSVYAVWGR